MTFSQIPPQYAPLGAEVPYAVEHSAAEDLDIRITDRNGSTLYGTLRFVASAAARFDAAPFLRRAARRFRPCGQQKSRPEGRLDPGIQGMVAMRAWAVSPPRAFPASIRHYAPLGRAVASVPGYEKSPVRGLIRCGGG